MSSPILCEQALANAAPLSKSENENLTCCTTPKVTLGVASELNVSKTGSPYHYAFCSNCDTLLDILVSLKSSSPADAHPASIQRPISLSPTQSTTSEEPKPYRSLQQTAYTEPQTPNLVTHPPNNLDPPTARSYKPVPSPRLFHRSHRHHNLQIPRFTPYPISQHFARRLTHPHLMTAPPTAHICHDHHPPSGLPPPPPSLYLRPPSCRPHHQAIHQTRHQSLLPSLNRPTRHQDQHQHQHQQSPTQQQQQQQLFLSQSGPPKELYPTASYQQFSPFLHRVSSFRGSV